MLRKRRLKLAKEARFRTVYAIFRNGGHAKKQWDRVHASEAYDALLHCFPLFSCRLSLACMHLAPLFYACPPFMNMVYMLSNECLDASINALCSFFTRKVSDARKRNNK